MSGDRHPAPPESQATFIAELQSRYAETGPGRLVSEADMERWTEIVGATRRDAYDVLARHLAIGFHKGQFSFGFCDALAIAVVGFVYDDFISLGEESWPSFFNEVYLAFDAGEVGQPGTDAVEAFARPMIAKIVEDLADDA
jgi:hypothetical protein